MSGIIHQKRLALNAIEVLQNNGFTAYLAGGCVRDELLGREPNDYDVATNALPDEVERLFPKTIAIGKAFGVIAVIDGNETVDVATFRNEVGTLDGRHPETVRFCDAREDAMRRDFTINGMFYDPIRDQLHDYVNGRSDLQLKRIVAIGNPIDRFREDHLRMLRAIRFAHNIGFSIDPETEAAIRTLAHLIRNISAERIEMELTRILVDSFQPGDTLHHLHRVGLLEHIMPEIIPMMGQEQPPQFHPEGDVFEHTVLMLNLMNEHMGQLIQPAQINPDTLVGQAFQPAHPEDEIAKNPFRPVEPSETLSIHRCRLPHWSQEHRVYFVTFRLADAIARSKLDQWREELDIWREKKTDPDSEETCRKQARIYRKKQQDWLDQGHGSCLLKNPECAHIVEEALFHFDGDRYRLGGYVVMPNHVHAILEPLEGWLLSRILHSWKGFSAREINKTLGREGPVWMDESFDHIIRRESFFQKFSRYINENPARAGLEENQYRLGHGSLQLAETMEGQAGKPAPHVEQHSPPTHVPTYTHRELAYAVLLHDVGKPPTASIGPGADGKPRIRFNGHADVGADMAEVILTRLKIPNKEKKHIVDTIRGHMRFMHVQEMRASTLRKMIGAETFDLEMELHRIDCLGSHQMLDNYDFLNNYIDEMANEPILPEPWIRGHDLLSMGYKAGPLIGRMLKEAYDAQMENRFATRDELMQWITSRY